MSLGLNRVFPIKPVGFVLSSFAMTYVSRVPFHEMKTVQSKYCTKTIIFLGSEPGANTGFFLGGRGEVCNINPPQK